MTVQQVLNSKGQPVLLTPAEQAFANVLQKKFNEELRNALGFEINITTLTQILKSVTEQKFFEVAPSDFMPVMVGEGAWSTQITKYRDYAVGDDFRTGILNTGSNDSRIAEVGAGMDAVNNAVNNWAKQITWTVMDVNIAAKSGNWDIVTSKERSRKKNWDLGIQSVAFFGINGTSHVSRGLLTLAGVTTNTSLITKAISSMTTSEFQAFIAAGCGYNAYRVNTAFTAKPTHMIIPETDFNGLLTAADETFPLKTRLQRIEETLKGLTGNSNFQVKPLAYCQQNQNSAIPGLNKNMYVLLNKDPDTLRMDIPVDYTNTMQNTLNGFQYQNVGYGQFTGVGLYRPLEVLYFAY